MADNVETLDALLDRETREVKVLSYQVSGLGLFKRDNGKWVPDYEETEDEYDDMLVIELDPSKSTPVIEKWDAGEGLMDDDLQEYALPEESE